MKVLFVNRRHPFAIAGLEQGDLRFRGHRTQSELAIKGNRGEEPACG